ncbi:MAG: hypothetical protein ACP5N2_04480 [Candidatus Nanoarchaeia archaeon]
MVHISLEEHLAEICPKCGKEHESKWNLEVDERHMYLKLTCVDCKYIIFRKIDFVIHDIEHLPKDSKVWHKNPYSLLGF